MYQYHCQLFLRHDLDIIPIAVFSDDARWREPVPDHFEMTVAGETIIRFHYRLIKLKHLDYREFLGSPNPLAYALMAKMDYTRRERVRLKVDFLRLILASDVDPARKSLLIDFCGDLCLPRSAREKSNLSRSSIPIPNTKRSENDHRL